MKIRNLLLLGLLAISSRSFAAEPPASIPLWAGGAPGSESKKDIPEVLAPPTATQDFWTLKSVHNPSITPYLPPKDQNTGVAVIVIPGGGHSMLAISHEGWNVGEWLSSHGIAAFVVKYRLAKEQGSTYKVDVEAIADVQRAIRTVRHRAKEWGVNSDAVGVMGFSAGGELAGLASMKLDGPIAGASDPVGQQSAKPNFQALIYPGQSQKIQPTKDTPPAFLAAGNLDRQDISEGIAKVYLLFKQASVPAELHIYAKTPHGFGIKPTDKPPTSLWPTEFRDWLDNMGFIKKPQ